jgi:ADP-ribose pyrophosphatase YjhB (NUDIX family)
VTGIVFRLAGRVLVVDAAGRLLLLKGVDPAGSEPPYWFTVGGGTKPGESLAQAAARELGEETGLAASADELGEPIWHEVAEFSFEGRRFRQEQDFFLLRLGPGGPGGPGAPGGPGGPGGPGQISGAEVNTDDLGDEEASVVLGHRWWTLTELESTDQRFYPAELPNLLRGHSQ